jgi:hypothetical protein
MNKPSRQRVALLHAEAAQRSLRDAEGTMSYQQVDETSTGSRWRLRLGRASKESEIFVT